MPNTPKTNVKRSWMPERKPFAREQKNPRLAKWQWRKLSLSIRASEPLCRECKAQGKVVLATCVDHIKSVMGARTEQEREQRMWDTNNLQPLCTPCHNKKSQQEKRS